MNCKKSLFFSLFLFISIHATAASWLFKDGQTDYTIVLAKDASVTERTAANELKTLLGQISGATFNVRTGTLIPQKAICVGWTAETGVTKSAADDEGYTYKTIGDNLYIYGGSKRGTMYGVYAFLERELGVRWFTSSVTKVPRLRQYALPQLDHSERPVIRQRLDFYYEALRHYDWAAHNLLNTQYLLADTKYGKMDAYWGIHTFKTLIPPETYFNTHPEYFSVYKGKRSDKAQLCLSNSEMRRELTKNLKAVMAQKPGYWCYDVSQNDNPWPCECNRCAKLVRKYGGQSGAMIWFVNQVAEDIKQTYPDKFIGTFAYQYTRQAPSNGSIKPAENVVVRLCDIECCMAHPLEQCPQNRSFLDDMNAWSKITKNIYIWDYATAFRNYLLPFPNFDVLAANLRYFSRAGVIGIMEEGAHDAQWGEFSELKQWLIAKLLWNPEQDIDSLASVFIDGYYGAAAPHIKKYYDLCKRQIRRDTHFTITIDGNHPLYTDQFIAEAAPLMQQALAATGKAADEQRRVRRIAAQTYYLKLSRSPSKSVADGTVGKLKDIVATDPTVMAELGLTLDQMLNKLKYR